MVKGRTRLRIGGGRRTPRDYSDDDEDPRAPSPPVESSSRAAVAGMVFVVAVLILYMSSYRGEALPFLSSPPKWVANPERPNEEVVPATLAPAITTPTPVATALSGIRLPLNMGAHRLEGKQLVVASWNLASFNTNPFEFWSTADKRVQSLLEMVGKEVGSSPGPPLSSIFTESMWEELKGEMGQAGLSLGNVSRHWQEYGAKRAYAEFLMDPALGKKRFVALADRSTNTIRTTQGKVMRPAVVTCYNDSLPSPAAWWNAWKQFMFHTDFSVMQGGRMVTKKGFEMIEPIPKFKYVAVTTEEIQISQQLQLLALAAFDALTLHLVSSLASGEWESLRRVSCGALGSLRTRQIITILERGYSDSDVILLQGASAEFVAMAGESELGKSLFDIRVPERVDHVRNSNSLVLLRKGMFLGPTEVTEAVVEHSRGKISPARGELHVVAATRLDNQNSLLLLSSYRGKPDDTTPVLVADALRSYALESRPLRKLIVGMDANTFTIPEVGQQGVEAFLEHVTTRSMLSSYGDHQDMYTTSNLRTHLQAQLSKGVLPQDRATRVNRHLKDHVLYMQWDFTLDSILQDNTGARRFDRDAPFPSEGFPSAHCITSVVLKMTATPYKTRLELAKEEISKWTPKPTPSPATPAPTGQATTKLTPPPVATWNTFGEEVNGSLVLPPDGVGLFIGVPNGTVLPDTALTSRDRPTVTAVCDNGLGDRLGSLYDAIWLAYMLRARFHMLWNMNNECRARFSVLFQFDGTAVSTPDNTSLSMSSLLEGRTPDFDAILTLKHHKNTNFLVPEEQSTVKSPGPERVWYSNRAREIALTEDGPLVQWAKDRLKRGMRVHILHHSDRLAKGVTLAGVKKALEFYNFRLSPVVLARLERFSQQQGIHPKTTIGVHLRSTDARIPLDIRIVLADVRRRFLDRKMFVCSDNKTAEDIFINAFPGKAFRNTLKTHFPGKLKGMEDQGSRLPGKPGATRFNVERSEPAVIDALMDLSVLSRTERPIIDGVLRDSSFGKLSTTLCIVGLSCNDTLAEIAALVPAPARPGV